MTIENNRSGISSCEQTTTDAADRSFGVSGNPGSPCFISFDKDSCGHCRSGVRGCRRCIDACSYNAISPGDEFPQIDYHACSVCAECVTVCPTGALQFNSPIRKNLLDQILEGAAGAVQPLIIFFRGPDSRVISGATDLNFQARTIDVEVDPVGALGMEILLASFAAGASGIIVSPGAGAESGSVRLLAEQVGIARLLIDGLGYHAGSISIMEPGSDTVTLSALVPRAGNPPKSAEYMTELTKRDLAVWAVNHLAARNDISETIIDLPTGAPFGEVLLENENCTLCMACTSLCPTEALSPSGNSAPGLLFRESLCVQCGLCAEGCPEKALHLNPGFNLRAIRTETPVLLKKEAPFACIRCGQPFAAPAMIAAILSRLSGHWMFGTEIETRRLQMCRTCRIKDMYENKKESGLK